MAEPKWIEPEALVVLHGRSLALHGGPEGIRDAGLLESALERPKNRYFYEGVGDLAELAATYAGAVSANHPFIDGNKRAAFVAMALFLRINGLRFSADKVDATRTVFALAAGDLSIDDLAAWIRLNLKGA